MLIFLESIYLGLWGVVSFTCVWHHISRYIFNFTYQNYLNLNNIIEAWCCSLPSILLVVFCCVELPWLILFSLFPLALHPLAIGVFSSLLSIFARLASSRNRHFSALLVSSRDQHFQYFCLPCILSWLAFLAAATEAMAAKIRFRLRTFDSVDVQATLTSLLIERSSQGWPWCKTPLIAIEEQD